MRVIAFILLILLNNALRAQVKSIRGVVINEETKQPLSKASVYINNTSLGTVSDESGRFALVTNPGNYELVISSIGFETKKMIVKLGTDDLSINISLRDKSVELDTVIVTPFEPDGWSRWGDLFKENFIGNSRNAKKCRIRNPEVLGFRVIDNRQKLKVVAREPLQIENYALGYMIQFDLDEFTLDFRTKSVSFHGFSFFKEILAKDLKQSGLWIVKRNKSYAGSLNHFLYSLYENKLNQEGFGIYLEQRLFNEEKRRVYKVMEDSLGLRLFVDPRDGEIYVFGNPKRKDSIVYFNSVIRQPDYIEKVDTIKLNPNQLILEISGNKRQMYFENSLRIIYTKEEEEDGYARQKGQRRKLPYQTSSMKLIKAVEITITDQGLFYDGDSIELFGYWGWEGMAELLPNNYRHERKN